MLKYSAHSLIVFTHWMTHGLLAIECGKHISSEKGIRGNFCVTAPFFLRQKMLKKRVHYLQFETVDRVETVDNMDFLSTSSTMSTLSTWSTVLIWPNFCNISSEINTISCVEIKVAICNTTSESFRESFPTVHNEQSRHSLKIENKQTMFLFFGYTSFCQMICLKLRRKRNV